MSCSRIKQNRQLCTLNKANTSGQTIRLRSLSSTNSKNSSCCSGFLVVILLYLWYSTKTWNSKSNTTVFCCMTLFVASVTCHVRSWIRTKSDHMRATTPKTFDIRWQLRAESSTTEGLRPGVRFLLVFISWSALGGSSYHLWLSNFVTILQIFHHFCFLHQSWEFSNRQELPLP